MPVSLFWSGNELVIVKLVTWSVIDAPMSMWKSRFHVVLAGMGDLRMNTTVPQRPPVMLESFPGVQVMLLFAASAPSHVGDDRDPPPYFNSNRVPAGRAAP